MPRGIDHLVLCVNDLKKARAHYEKLGFTMTPQAQHPFGTGNTLAQLQGCFLEVLAVTQPEDITEADGDSFSFAAFNRDFLSGREGFSMLVLDSADEKADRAEFLERNLHVYAPFEFQRLAKLPDGSEETVGFSLTFVGDESLPDLGFFTCKQWRPDLFWKEDYQKHANGAETIDEVFLVTPEPSAPVQFLATFADATDFEVDEGIARIRTERGALGVYTPAAFENRFPGAFDAAHFAAPCLAGFAVKTANAEKAASLWRENGLDVHDTNGVRWLHPTDAFGCVIAAVQASG
ncbi:MAG: VOC family protein [Rhodospirillales bacterium]|nr:VOC family protein [Rhodospirillales bacterium]MBO6788215.1 VOC family protein [Rhodospirillales bacterium]